MTAIQKIASTLKTFSGKPLGVASKVLGVATIASVAYDSHINAKERAFAQNEKDTANRMSSQFKQFMQMEKPSATTAKLKRILYDTQQDFPLYTPISKTKGYAAGFGRTLLADLPLVVLSAVALKFKTAGKVAGVLLAANGIRSLCCDVFGIGTKQNNHNKIKF